MSRNGGGAENDSKTDTSGKGIETIYCRQLSVIKLYSIHDTTFFVFNSQETLRPRPR